ncbi:MAG TPA: hypothetical protein VHB98_24360 [Chloroflexota bacterium]|nr:hypothetical protein [Chloroflexota bacterium]
MARRSTAHDLADYARCPRAWWYERHHELARLDTAALSARLQARRAALGRHSRHDAEIELILRLLQRRQRFAGGRAAHQAVARQQSPHGRIGCLPAVALLCLLVCSLCLLFAR